MCNDKANTCNNIYTHSSTPLHPPRSTCQDLRSEQVLDGACLSYGHDLVL